MRIPRALPALQLAIVLLAFSAVPSRAYFESRLAGARGISMGTAAAANTEDVSAVWWNPAGLAGLRDSQVLLDYAQPYLTTDVTENSALIGTKYRGAGVALGWHYLGVTGVYRELALAASAGKELAVPAQGHSLAAGATFQYARVSFDPFTVVGTGEAVDYGAQAKGTLDVGLRWRTPWRVDLAWVGRDLLVPRFRLVEGSPGGRLDFRNELAAAFRWNRESTVTAAWSSSESQRNKLDLGAEIWFYEVFAIRSGFSDVFNILGAQDSPDVFQFTGGFGIRHKGWQVDASALTQHELGVSYRASLLKSFRMGGHE